MSIHFVCPHCGAAKDVAEQYAGQTGPCANCGKPIAIPHLSNGAAAAAPRSRNTTAIVLVVVAAVAGAAILGVVLLAALLLPAVSSARDAARRAQCSNNLKQIALAMMNYETANGCFPPAYLPDNRGKPMVSWRVLLLPYMERQDIYDRYHFNEPWDSPNNRAVTDMALDLYHCPSQPADGKAQTSYVMVVGTHSISKGEEACKIADITDGLSNTILIVEVADSGIAWAEPRDLQFNQIDYKINNEQRKGKGISSHHARGANAAFCDGSVRFLKDSTNPQLVKAMLTIDGAEIVPTEN